MCCSPCTGPGHSCGLPGSSRSSEPWEPDQGQSGCYRGCHPVCQQRHHCFHCCAVSRSDKDKLLQRSQWLTIQSRCTEYNVRGSRVCDHRHASYALSGLVMVAVIVGSRKVGINPDNVATPIAASLGDLITLSLLAGVSSLFFCYRGQRSHHISPFLYTVCLPLCWSVPVIQNDLWKR